MCIILIRWEIELSETKVNNFYSLCLWVDQNVKWFDITMHDTLRMHVIKSLN